MKSELERDCEIGDMLRMALPAETLPPEVSSPHSLTHSHTINYNVVFLVITSAKESMFSSAFVTLFVSNFALKSTDGNCMKFLQAMHA